MQNYIDRTGRIDDKIILGNNKIYILYEKNHYPE